MGETAWREPATVPHDGAFLVKNALGQVCLCDSRDGHRTIHNVVGFADWEYGTPVTGWMPLPPAEPSPEPPGRAGECEGHTPTPWKTDPDTNGEGVLGPDGALVADCTIFCNPKFGERDDTINRANAALIVAAVNAYASPRPDLEIVEALRRIKQFGELACVDVEPRFDRPSGKKPATKDVWQFPRYMLDDIDALLSRVEGKRG